MTLSTVHPDVAATARVLARIRLELARRNGERPVRTGRRAELEEGDRGSNTTDVRTAV